MLKRLGGGAWFLSVVWLASCGSSEHTPVGGAAGASGEGGTPTSGGHANGGTAAQAGAARGSASGSAGAVAAGGSTSEGGTPDFGGAASAGDGSPTAGAGGETTECVSACNTGETQCAEGAISVCTWAEGTCWVWGAPSPCASGKCAGAACQAVKTEDGQCSVDGWCWVEPHPHGHALLGLAQADGHVWAVGEGGEIVHRDAAGKFSTERWPGLPTLFAVAALSANDVWAIGAKGLVLHHTANGWEQVPSTTTYDLYAIRAFAADDIVIGGGNDTTTDSVLLRYDGKMLGKFEIGVTPTSVHSLGGSGSSDLYVGGRGLGGYAVYYDGKAFSYLTALLAKLESWQNLTAITSFKGDLYVATSLNNGKVWRRQAGVWQSVALGVSEPVWALEATADKLYAVSDSGLRSYDGVSFQPELAFQARGAGSVVVSGSNVFVSGQGGRIFQGSASTYGLVYGSDFPGAGTAPLLVARTENDIFWVSGTTLHFDGNAWKQGSFPLPLNSQSLFQGPHQLWSTSSQHVLTWDGAGWVEQYTAPSYMRAVFEAENGEVWAAGDSAPVHFDGQAWSLATTAPLTETINAMHGTAHDDIWAVGRSAIYHYDGKAWSRQTAPIIGTDTLTSVHAITREDAWFGGANGKFYHYDGKTVTSFKGAPGYWITSMAAISSNDVFATETTQVPHGYISHFDGTQWTAMDTGCAHPLHQVYVQDEDTVWAAGTGALLRWKRPKP